MKEYLVFNRKTGEVGVQRFQDTLEGRNYKIVLLDPMNYREVDTIEDCADWVRLPNNDARVKYWRVMDAIYNARWYYNGYHDGDTIIVDEAYIENEHEVFEEIRKVFKGG